MGMYDFIVCRYPLPTVPPEFTKGDYHRYQSKSLDCIGATYEITEDGQIRQSDAGMFQSLFDHDPFDFSGIIEFYDSNWCSAAFGITFTVDGEDYESVTYEATFFGTVKKIVETERERKPSLSRAVYDRVNGMFEEDKPVIDMAEPEVGAEMYVLWGSIDRNMEGYPVKLIAKTSRDWAFVGPDEKIETIHPGQLGNCLFHSEADAKAQRAHEHWLWDRRTEYCKELLRKGQSER